MRLILLAGGRGSGKDTAAEILVPRHLVKVDGRWLDIRKKLGKLRQTPALVRSGVQLDFADPLKVFAKEIYDFSWEQLWGPSHLRESTDERWVLSPRMALQRLGDEWGRTCNLDTWTKYLERQLESFQDSQVWEETAYGTFSQIRPDLVVVGGTRYINEAEWARSLGGEVWLIRSRFDHGPEAHASEQQVYTREFEALATKILTNESSLDEFRLKIEEAYASF